MNLNQPGIAQDNGSKEVPLSQVVEKLKYLNKIPKKKPFDFYQNYQEEESNEKITKGQKSRRVTVKWSNEEQEFLLNGYRKYHRCWTQILMEYPMNPVRQRCDLKDKWKNIQKKCVKDSQIGDALKNIEDTKNHTSEFFLRNDANNNSGTKDLKIENLVPRRCIPMVYRVLENPDYHDHIVKQWEIVVQKPELMFSFIKECQDILATLTKQAPLNGTTHHLPVAPNIPTE